MKERTKLQAGLSVTFVGNLGVRFQLDQALAKAAMFELIHQAPGLVSFPELTVRALARLNANGQEPPAHDAGAEELTGALFELYLMRFIDLRQLEPRFVVEPSVRPNANAFVRWLSGQTRWLPTQFHRPAQIEEERGLKLVALLDGTRGKTKLLTDWREELGAHTGKPVSEHDLAMTLSELGRLRLLQS